MSEEKINLPLVQKEDLNSAVIIPSGPVSYHPQENHSQTLLAENINNGTQR